MAGLTIFMKDFWKDYEEGEAGLIRRRLTSLQTILMPSHDSS
jgi:hypothetical protein